MRIGSKKLVLTVFAGLLCLPTLALGATDPRVAVFVPRGFPSAEATPIASTVLNTALKGLPVDRLTSDKALGRWKGAPGDTLVLPHGSAYPAAAWPAIRSFLRRGGNLVVLGGRPFHVPVRRSSRGKWVSGSINPGAAQELLIGPGEPLQLQRTWPDGEFFAADPSWKGPLPSSVQEAFALTVRLTDQRLDNAHGGSDGPRDAVLRPLIHYRDQSGIPRAAPLMEIDQLRGHAAGGRWVLAPFNGQIGARFIRAAIDRARQGALELRTYPLAATVGPAETPRLRVRRVRPRPLPADPVGNGVTARLLDEAGAELARADATMAPVSGSSEWDSTTTEADIEFALTRKLRPGYYRVMFSTEAGETSTSGFWVRDQKLLRPGPKVTASRDWIQKDGQPLPVVGTTYMDSEVQRRFLLEPNPDRWMADFATMRQHGVNFVRTGIWFGWHRYLDAHGRVKPSVLRALEAYVHTAARHDILVAFTFFAFIPPSFGAPNPYISRVAKRSQARFVRDFASAFRGVGWIHWDLINEPSYGPEPFTHGVMGDVDEQKAWARWVRKKHGDDPNVWSDRWRQTSGELLAVPVPEDFLHGNQRNTSLPRKGADFLRFSQDVVRDWAAELRKTISRSGTGLVTVGQDEGGVKLRPAQQLHADVIDYTSIHSWWQNDDLLWDGVAARVPEKPLLVSETGLMRLDNVDGLPWRTPEQAAQLLERKFAYAFAARGAGAVQWAWNINPYQPSEGEPVIGFWRPDGTAKPELRVVDDLAAFWKQAGPYLTDFASDEVVLVIPHSRMYLRGNDVMPVTKRAIRVLSERLGVVPTAISELTVSQRRLSKARLVIVPSPQVLSRDAAATLAAAARKGVHVLLTGGIRGDAYGKRSTDVLGLAEDVGPVSVREPSQWGEGWVTFEGRLQEKLLRATGPRSTQPNVIHEPLPLEQANEEQALVRLYAHALQKAGVQTRTSATPIATRVLTNDHVALVVCVNEAPAAVTRRLEVDGRSLTIPVKPGRSRLVLVERKTGKILVSNAGAKIKTAALLGRGPTSK